MSKKLLLALVVILVLGAGLGIYFYFKYFRYVWAAETHEIVLTENGFEPASITIKQFDIVRFRTGTDKNFWPASDLHPLHDIYPEFDPKMPIKPDESWSFRFTRVGTWKFHDHLFSAHRGVIVVTAPGRDPGFSLEDTGEFKQKVKQAISVKGAGSAYEEVKSNFRDNPASRAHLAAHILGEILYEELGTKGIEICDDEFGFGCYHGLFARAIAERGEAVAKEFDDICIEKFGSMGLGCPHGIGHGLGEYFGPENLAKQLEICSGLNWQGELFGCSGGVFMEYNFPTQIDNAEARIGVRELVGEDYYSPCNDVPVRFQHSCFFEQGSWWLEVLGEGYKRAGEICLDAGSFSEDCFAGIGNNIIERSNYDSGKAISACSEMPDPQSEALCRAGAAWAFFADPARRDQSASLCGGLDAYEGLCLEKRILVNEENQ